jgi:hypothetical protein
VRDPELREVGLDLRAALRTVDGTVDGFAVLEQRADERVLIDRNVERSRRHPDLVGLGDDGHRVAIHLEILAPAIRSAGG